MLVNAVSEASNIELQAKAIAELPIPFRERADQGSKPSSD
jgi:hypothetical protein